jgi:hypothetical protein
MFQKLAYMDEHSKGLPERLNMIIINVLNTCKSVILPAHNIKNAVYALTSNDRKQGRIDKLTDKTRNAELAAELSGKISLVLAENGTSAQSIQALNAQREAVGIKSLVLARGKLEGVQPILLPVAIGASIEDYESYVFVNLYLDSQAGAVYYDCLPEYSEIFNRTENIDSRVILSLANELNSKGLISASDIGKVAGEQAWSIEYPSSLSETIGILSKIYPELQKIVKRTSTLEESENIEQHLLANIGLYQMLRSTAKSGVMGVTRITLKFPVKKAELTDLEKLAQNNPNVDIIIEGAEGLKGIKEISDKLYKDYGVRLIVNLPQDLSGNTIAVITALDSSDILIDISKKEAQMELLRTLSNSTKNSVHNIIAVCDISKVDPVAVKEQFGIEVIAEAGTTGEIKNASVNGSGVLVKLLQGKNWSDMESLCKESMYSRRLVLDISSFKTDGSFMGLSWVSQNGANLIEILNKVLSLLPQSKVQASDIRQQAARNYMWKMAGDKVKTQDAQKIFKQMKLALDNLDKLDKLLSALPDDKIAVEKQKSIDAFNTFTYPINETAGIDDSIKQIMNNKVKDILDQINGENAPTLNRTYLKEARAGLMALIGGISYNTVSYNIADIDAAIEGLMLENIKNVIAQINSAVVKNSNYPGNKGLNSLKDNIMRAQQRDGNYLTDKQAWVIIGELLLFMIQDRYEAPKLQKQVETETVNSVRRILSAG